jgi:hypothetical protein
MADLSAEKCLESHERGDFFTLEHPARSIALHLENWQRLMSQPGIQVINCTTCMFEGSRRRKCQVNKPPGFSIYGALLFEQKPL